MTTIEGAARTCFRRACDHGPEMGLWPEDDHEQHAAGPHSRAACISQRAAPTAAAPLARRGFQLGNRLRRALCSGVSPIPSAMRCGWRASRPFTPISSQISPAAGRACGMRPKLRVNLEAGTVRAFPWCASSLPSRWCGVGTARCLPIPITAPRTFVGVPYRNAAVYGS